MILSSRGFRLGLSGLLGILRRLLSLKGVTSIGRVLQRHQDAYKHLKRERTNGRTSRFGRR